MEAIERIEKYATRGRDAFMTDELIQSWIVHHLLIIGEAVGGLSEKLRNQHPQVPWAQIKAMRNILIHTYFNVNLEVIWSTVLQDLPTLKQHILVITDNIADQNVSS